MSAALLFVVLAAYLGMAVVAVAALIAWIGGDGR